MLAAAVIVGDMMTGYNVHMYVNIKTWYFKIENFTL